MVSPRNFYNSIYVNAALKKAAWSRPRNMRTTPAAEANKRVVVVHIDTRETNTDTSYHTRYTGKKTGFAFLGSCFFLHVCIYMCVTPVRKKSKTRFLPIISNLNGSCTLYMYIKWSHPSCYNKNLTRKDTWFTCLASASALHLYCHKRFKAHCLISFRPDRRVNAPGLKDEVDADRETRVQRCCQFLKTLSSNQQLFLLFHYFSHCQVQAIFFHQSPKKIPLYSSL